MRWWDKKLLAKLQDIGLTTLLYKRYVDDINVAMQAVPCGATLQDGRMVIDVDRVDEQADDIRTMSILKQVGDSIHASIQLETDCPSNNADGKVPILDLKLWVNGDGLIMHEHYMKPVSSRFTVHAKSAISQSAKRQILTQDALRILLNCSKSMLWRDKVVHLEKYTERLQYSGYDAKMRYEIIDSAVKAYRSIEQAEREGKRPMYRQRGWRYAERERNKYDKRRNWYRNGGYQSVMFVPSTPHSMLKKEFDMEIKKSRFSIRVVEKAGRSLKDTLQKSNPFKERTCKRPRCPVCLTAGKGRCEQSSVTYEIVCQSCGGKYIGQTARSLYEREGGGTCPRSGAAPRSSVAALCGETWIGNRGISVQCDGNLRGRLHVAEDHGVGTNRTREARNEHQRRVEFCEHPESKDILVVGNHWVVANKLTSMSNY